MKHILVVDDCAEIRNLLRTMLEEEGYAVSVAADGRRARDAFSGVDLVITDIFMPGVDGFDTLRSLRQTHPHVKAIALSGGGGLAFRPDDMLGQAKILGAAKTLQKPFAMRDLLGAVRELLED